MFSFKVSKVPEFPKFDFTKHLNIVAKKIVIPILEDGIDRSEDVKGGRFPSLEPGTIKGKGHDQPLVDTATLRLEGFKHRKGGKNEHFVYIKKNRRDIVEYLQIDGVGRKKKKFNIIGVSKRMELDSIALMEDIVIARIRRWNRGK